VLVDGPSLPGCAYPQTAIIDGDAKSAAIAAASIVAKVARDAFMTQLDATYPGYGFANNKGYATSDHLAALNAFGPCPAHRRSFTPVVQPTFDFAAAGALP
jgi:ribonuclease HII